MYFDIKMPESISKKEHLSLKALAWLNFEMRSAASTITLHELVEELKYQRKRLYEVTKQLRLQIQTDQANTYKL